MYKLLLPLAMAGSIFYGSTAIASQENNSQPPNPALSKIINERSAQDRSRDKYRNPQKTLDFFGITNNMVVAEVLPGGGWYSRILAPYLAENGALHGLNYADDMWPLFSFFSAEAIAKRKQAMVDFPISVDQWGGNGKKSQGFAFNNVPKNITGSLDAVLFIRALHNLNRFESTAKTRSKALEKTYTLLKPNGIVGVVQHRAPEQSADAWANGSAGYLKQSAVITMFKTAGFELVKLSQINANPNDKPTASDVVWRLPPSLRGVKNDPNKVIANNAIGESDRMTLLFQKAAK